MHVIERGKQRLRNTVFAFSLAAMHMGSAALANESSLILPAKANSNIEFTLAKEQGDIDPAKRLQVFVGHQEACCDGKSPMAGRYSVTGNTVIFDPAFDFVKGQSYTVLLRDSDVKNKVTRELREFTIESASEIIKPEVVKTYPSGVTLPENTLRFYIHFSTPMKPHLSAKFIKLVDADGKPDNAAFMSFKQELWSEDRKRLTLLMDPGRIKRGVAQNLTLGPALLEGNAYSIIVEAGWPSATSAQKTERFEKRFSVSQAIRTLPDSNLWAIEPPEMLSRDPLVIKFDRPFDHQLLQNGIRILDSDGRFIPGIVSIDRDEKTWRFEPESMWAEESLQIAIDARLEDVAGNNFKELLDHTLDTKAKTVDRKVITVKLSKK